MYEMVDPSTYYEIEFEAEVVKALCCLYPDYLCRVFAGTFELDGERHSADLALVHRSLSHWFVVEVELVSHSLEGHVLPQVRCFRYGEPADTCVSSLCNSFPEFNRQQAEMILKFIPRSVAVVANRLLEPWRLALLTADTQLLVVSAFRGPSGQIAHEVEGSLRAVRSSIGFYRYSTVDRSFRLPRTCGLVPGELQIEDPYGSIATWIIREDGDVLWLTRVTGDPTLPNNEYVQILRTFGGRIAMKLST